MQTLDCALIYRASIRANLSSRPVEDGQNCDNVCLLILDYLQVCADHPRSLAPICMNHVVCSWTADPMQLRAMPTHPEAPTCVHILHPPYCKPSWTGTCVPRSFATQRSSCRPPYCLHPYCMPPYECVFRILPPRDTQAVYPHTGAPRLYAARMGTYVTSSFAP